MAGFTSKKNRNFYALFFAGLLAVVFLHLYIFTKNIALKYDVVHLKVKLKDLKKENRFLLSKVSYEESLLRIAQKASKLNMYYPKKIDYVLLTGETKI